MGIWYEVEKTESGIKDFLECNWYFHDFKILRFSYDSEDDVLEVFLKYDSIKDSILLKFIGVNEYNLVAADSEYDDELGGSLLILNSKSEFMWISDDSYPDMIDEMKKYASWVIADRIIWAMTDEKGEPTEMPDWKLNQIWKIYDNEMEKHFKFKEYIV